MSRKANVESYIRYQARKSDGNLYATFCPADRRHGGKDLYLGVTVDKEGGIFFNRKTGYIRFTIESGITPLNPDEAEYISLVRKRDAVSNAKRLILDFGDAWFLDYVMESSGLKNLFDKVLPKDSKTLLSLIAFKLLDTNANVYAERWYAGSYAKYLYPSAALSSPRISEFMDRLGKEETKRTFFDMYIPYLKGLPGVSENILIDSTGLPNDIHFDYSQISNHNGVISREARLIYVVERNSGLPVYFRYVAGNIIDVTTLRVTINHLKAQGIEVKHGILDAGYCSGKNVNELYKNNIPFLTRLPNNSLAKMIIKENGMDVMDTQYALEYGKRLLFIKRVSLKLFGHDLFVYISVDFNRLTDEQERYYHKAVEKRTKNKPVSEMEKSKLGYFVMISSEKLEPIEVLPLYYMRQTIEQTFDFAKNDVALLPIRSHTDETFRGHLLLSFMATVALITVRRMLKTRKKTASMPAAQALQAMRYIKCDVFTRSIVTSEPGKYANLIINELNLDVPGMIDL